MRYLFIPEGILLYRRKMDRCCDMRGFLSFLVLWLIGKKPMSGEDLRQELEKRKGHKPSPGTIYPVLKYLQEYGWIEEIKDKGKAKKYRLTKSGEKELKDSTRKFVSIFCDMGNEFKKAR